MDKITFDEKRIAEGYMNRPWLHKKVIERFVSDCEVTSNFRNGLDVGCGAGLSTKALHLICDRVTGTDISEQMIQVCKEEYKDNKAYTFYRAKAEETKEPAEKYDIVTAAGMVNWVDRDLFLENMGHALQDQGILLIYDFWIIDKMQGNDAYTNWYHEEYLKRFPKTSRNENTWKQSELPDYFRIKNQITYELFYDFSMEQFIDFMMIQSNVNTNPFPNHLRFHQEYWLHRSRPKYYFGLYKALSAYEAQIFLQLLRQLPATALWQAFHRKNPI